MTPEEGLDSLENALRAVGTDVARDELLGRPAVIASWTDFKWRWFATRLHVSLVACPFSSGDASTDDLDRFLAAARDHAVSRKRGLPLGFQTGVAVIALAVAQELGQEASAWASHGRGAKFAALAYPVTVDLRTGTCTRPDRMTVGAVYVPYLRRFVDSVAVPALVGSSGP